MATVGVKRLTVYLACFPAHEMINSVCYLCLHCLMSMVRTARWSAVW